MAADVENSPRVSAIRFVILKWIIAAMVRAPPHFYILTRKHRHGPSEHLALKMVADNESYVVAVYGRPF